MEELILERIERRLDILIRLLASKSVEGKTKTESILALGSLGLERNLIAKIVGTTPETVTSRLSEAKRKTKSRIKEAIREEDQK